MVHLCWILNPTFHATIIQFRVVVVLVRKLLHPFNFTLFIKSTIYSWILTECRSISTEEDDQTYAAREEPDGEETISTGASAATTRLSAVPSRSSRSVRLSDVPGDVIDDSVKVPDWVMAEASLDVLFNERANQQIAELQVNRVSSKSKYASIRIQFGDSLICCRQTLWKCWKTIRGPFICERVTDRKYSHFNWAKWRLRANLTTSMPLSLLYKCESWKIYRLKLHRHLSEDEHRQSNFNAAIKFPH